MKSILVLILILSMNTFAQSINKEKLIGVWQEKTAEISDAYLGTYQFFNNNKFIYHTNQYDGLQRVISIKGTYRIVQDTLFLKVESTLERMGGFIERSSITTLSDSWEIVNPTVKEIKQRLNDEQAIVIENCSDNNKSNCLSFDKWPYFKIFNDPNKLK